MSITRLMSYLRRGFARLVPQRLHTPAANARLRVERLDLEQRRALADNLRRMLRPDAG